MHAHRSRHRVRTIGLHVDTAFEHARRVVEGVLDFAAETPSWTIEDLRHNANEPAFAEETDPPWTGRVDGVVASIGREDGILEWCERGGVPVVNAAADMADTWLPSVFTSVESIARLAVDHALELDRRSVLHVGYAGSDGSTNRKTAIRERLSGHRMRLAVYDLPRFSTNPHEIAADEGLRNRISRMERPVFVVTLSDEFADAVCRIVESLGWTIPDDVAVLGVNDSATARLATPTLSSIRTPGRAIGNACAQKLEELIDAAATGGWVRERGHNVRVDAVDLVERESTRGRDRAVFTDVDRARRFIQEHGCEGIRVVDVARHVRMPLRTFEIEFRRETGRTVGEELRQVRLERAQDLLANTKLPTSRIADLAGFADASYLAAFFRRVVGVTPTEYRRRTRASHGT